MLNRLTIHDTDDFAIELWNSICDEGNEWSKLDPLEKNAVISISRMAVKKICAFIQSDRCVDPVANLPQNRGGPFNSGWDAARRHIVTELRDEYDS